MKKVSQYAYLLILILFLCLTCSMVFLVPRVTAISAQQFSGRNSAQVSEMLIDGKININTANAEILALLNGIGDETAARIVDYRNDHGPFRRVDELDDVKGIGSATLKQIRNYITVGG